MSTVLNTSAAMSVAVLIDEYRHEHNQAIDSYLNEYESLQGLEKALEEFYRRQGITDVTPDMIKAGIEAYQRQRLTYKGVQGGFITRWMAKAFFKLPGRKTAGLGFISFIVSTCVVFTFLGALGSIQSGEFTHNVSVLETEISKAQAVMVVAQKAQPKYAGEGLLIRQNALETALTEAGDIVLQGKRLIEQNDYSSELSTSEAYSRVREVAHQVQQLLNADQIMQGVESGSLYERYKSDDEVISAHDSAVNSLRTGNGTDAMAAVTSLRQTIDNKGVKITLKNRVEQLEKRLHGAFKDKAGQDKLKALLSQAYIFALGADTQSVDKTIERVLQLERYVMSDLFIRLDHVHTGFLRTIGRNKRHYLVASAVDASGNAYPRDVTSIETGVTETVTKWGQHVSEEEYQKVRQDKADGALDDDSFGVKPRGYYEITYARPQLNASITRW